MGPLTQTFLVRRTPSLNPHRLCTVCCVFSGELADLAETRLQAVDFSEVPRAHDALSAHPGAATLQAFAGCEGEIGLKFQDLHLQM